MTRLSPLSAAVVSALLAACVSPDKDQGSTGSYRYVGYAGRTLDSGKDTLLRIRELDREVRDTLDRTGYQTLKTFDFRPDGVVVATTEAGRTVTAEYAVSGDSVKITLPNDEGVIPGGLREGKLTIMICIYQGGFWKQTGPCVVPPPDIWPFTTYFSSHDTLPAHEVTFTFAK